MAVEARPPHLNHLFPYPLPQLIPTRGDFIGERQLYDTVSARMEYGALPPIASSSKMAAHDEVIFPAFYRSSAACAGRFPPVKSVDSGLTMFDDSMLGAPRKRARDSVDYASSNAPVAPRKIRLLSVVDRNVALDIHRQQSELDQLITQHIRRMRVEIEEKFRRQSRELLAVIQQGVVWKLSEKDEEIRRAGRLNMALQERVKTLCVENRLLRGMAQKSEAAVKSLRSNLDQVLAVAGAAADSRICSAVVAVEEDAESCCGSGGEATKDEQTAGGSGGSPRRRLCRGCREKETCVLLLPCRHLCLCTACGSAVQCCPVCGSAMTGTIHVNMS